jgi:hypothetical protein
VTKMHRDREPGIPVDKSTVPIPVLAVEFGTRLPALKLLCRYINLISKNIIARIARDREPVPVPGRGKSCCMAPFETTFQ